ncbi:hypothetical protein VTL71DRAFT_8774 [Oculimacula yallundae]|uniref:Uncharacterized protein n=1 Tax=Oculimacula yallundae TaxID=86028 RepID=A0ABR4CYM5_9HELO
MNPSDKPQPVVLSFVNYGAGKETQNVESKKIVKSHVSRRWHQDKRIAETIKYAGSQRAFKGARSMNSAGVGGDKTYTARETKLLLPSFALPYLEGLIPYSYFTGGGPVLYLKPSKWPFARPFSMAGASPTQKFGQSQFPRQSIWMPDADVPDRVAMKGPLLGGDVLSWISHTPECFKYRGETINWIQRQLQSPSVAASDGTIGAIMTLTMWENGDGSSLDLSNHMDGLESIVKLKGGVSQLQQLQMSRKLIMFDYIIAISLARKPRFPNTAPPPSNLPPSHNPQVETLAGSPIYGNGDFSQLECSWRREDTKYILQAMWELTNQFLEPEACLNSQSRPQNRPRTLISTSMLDPWPTAISAPQNITQNTEEMHIFETLHRTAMIYERAVTPPYTHFNSPTNFADLSFLYTSLNTSAGNPFWIQYPGILLWVLLVGCATSVKREERSYFMMFLAKVGIFSDERSWNETQTAVLRFVNVQGLRRMF